MAKMTVQRKRRKSREPAPRPPTTAADLIDDARVKEAIYLHIGELIKKHVGGRRPGRDFSKELFESTMEIIFACAIHGGIFRLPKGLGTLSVQYLGATRRKLPTGEHLELPASRPIMRYREGLAVRAALGKNDKYPGRQKPISEILRNPQLLPLK